MAGAGRVLVDFPDEHVTGADMEWNFANPDDGTFFRVLVQAKQAYGQGRIWTRHNYRELFHITGSSGTLQTKMLCDAARQSPATYPLYIFYHPAQTCDLARASGIQQVEGVTLADGYQIERLVLAASTRRLRQRNKSLGAVAPLLFPLTDLFCPTSVLPLRPWAYAQSAQAPPLYVAREHGRLVFGVAIPPSPKDVRQRLVERRATLDAVYENIPQVPEISKTIPLEVLSSLADRQRQRSLNHLRVTFVSASASKEGDAHLFD